MNQSGRVNPVTLLAVVAIVLFAFVLLFSREGVSTVGARFMGALARHDVDTLTKMTYLGEGISDEEIRKKWDFAVNEAGKHYRFAWKVTGTTQTTENEAAVRLQVVRNMESGAAYEENFQLPLVKRNGEWKVFVRGINREMFPALPR
ncbi:MAG TPA: hypothetical protein VGE01_10110 [Fimbriimonas sp.]